MLFMHKNIRDQDMDFVGNDNEEVVDKLILPWSSKEADMTRHERARKMVLTVLEKLSLIHHDNATLANTSRKTLYHKI